MSFSRISFVLSAISVLYSLSLDFTAFEHKNQWKDKGITLSRENRNLRSIKRPVFGNQRDDRGIGIAAKQEIMSDAYLMAMLNRVCCSLSSMAWAIGLHMGSNCSGRTFSSFFSRG